MRAQRQRIKLLELGGADEDEIITARGRYMTTSSEYVRFSKEMRLPQQRERVTVDNLYNIGQKNYYKPVEKSTDSGIIKEESKKPITIITDNSINRVSKINVSGYTEEQCTELQKQHKELLKYARDNNDSKEVAFVFRKGLKDRSTPIKGTDDKLDFGTSLLGKGEDLIILHNHPRNSSYSITDLMLFKRCNDIKTLTIVKNNGDVEYITKGENYNAKILKLEFDRFYSKIVLTDTNAEKDKFVRKLLSKTKSGVIWSGNK